MLGKGRRAYVPFVDKVLLMGKAQQSLHAAFWWWLWVGLTKSNREFTRTTYSKPVEHPLTAVHHL